MIGYEVGDLLGYSSTDKGQCREICTVVFVGKNTYAFKWLHNGLVELYDKNTVDSVYYFNWRKLA